MDSAQPSASDPERVEPDRGLLDAEGGRAETGFDRPAGEKSEAGAGERGPSAHSHQQGLLHPTHHCQTRQDD